MVRRKVVREGHETQRKNRETAEVEKTCCSTDGTAQKSIIVHSAGTRNLQHVHLLWSGSLPATDRLSPSWGYPQFVGSPDVITSGRWAAAKVVGYLGRRDRS